MEDVVNGETRDVHIARMCFNSDRHLQIDRPLQDAFRHLENKGENDRICSIIGVKKPSHGDGNIARVEWKGLEGEESIWKPVSRVFADVPTIPRSELGKSRPEAKLKRALNFIHLVLTARWELFNDICNVFVTFHGFDGLTKNFVCINQFSFDVVDDTVKPCERFNSWTIIGYSSA